MAKEKITELCFNIAGRKYTAREPLAKDFKSYISLLRRMEALTEEEKLDGKDIDLEFDFIASLFSGITAEYLLTNLTFGETADLRNKYHRYLYDAIPEGKN